MTGPRIVAARADRVAIPFRRPFATASGMWLERESWLVTLTDADGRTGVGEAVLEPADGETAGAVLVLLLREAVEAVAAGGPLPDEVDLEGHGRPGRALRAALETATLDLAGPPTGEAGVAATGVAPAGVPVNATIPLLGAAASAQAALQAVEAGFRTLKLKGGHERESEELVARVRAVRRAVGPEVRLRLDVNGAWDRPTAEDRLEALARLGLEYVEQPLPADDLEGLAGLRRRFEVPIAADESVESLRAARDVLAAGAADVLVVKSARVGGPGVVSEIASMAAARGVRIVVSTLFETGVGIAAGLAAAARLAGTARDLDHGLATAGLLEHDLLVEHLPVEAGRMHLPEPPGAGGLGITLEPRAVQRYRVESIEAPG